MLWVGGIRFPVVPGSAIAEAFSQVSSRSAADVLASTLFIPSCWHLSEIWSFTAIHDRCSAFEADIQSSAKTQEQPPPQKAQE